MQLSAFIFAALSLGSAMAADITVHVVRVGSTNGSTTYSPNNIKAAVGDMVQFQFSLANHTVTQSTFDAPCTPINQKSNITGIFSGFMPVKATDTTVPTYTIKVANTTPMWLYCSQAKHCQNGMVMVINENTTANATRSLANYAAGAKLATANLAPSSALPATGNTNNGNNSGSSASSSAVGSSPTSAAPVSTTTGAAKTTGAATSLQVGGAIKLGGALAVMAGLLL